MFQDDNKKKVLWDPALEKKFSIENIPVHSMANDLAELEHPSKPATQPATEKVAPKKSEPVKITAEKSAPVNPSPFAQPIQKPVITAPSTPKPLAQSKPEIKKPNEGEKSPAKVFAFIALLLLLFAAGFGGYYYWTTQKQTITPAETPATQEPIANTENPTTPPIDSTFSLDKPNYLPTDITIANSASIKALLAEYAQKAQEQNIEKPAEFIVTDIQNNPVALETFASAAGITFSKELMERLDNDFSLFIYNDAGKYRLGLSVGIKNIDGLKEIMLKEESNLPSEIQPLFLTGNYTIEAGKAFATSTLENAPEIRYVNITSPEDLSVDYTIQALTPNGPKLLIGTTKLTLRTLIQHYQAVQ